MFVLKLKHWQVFIPMVLAFFVMNVTIEGNPQLSGMLTLIGLLIWFSWLFLTGNSLYQLLPARIEVNHTLYIINSFLWIAVYAIIMIISDGQGMTFEGWIALPFFYVVFAFLHFLTFPAKMLVSIEKNKKASFGEYFETFLLLCFAPIGIWLVQPRINKIVNKEGNEEPAN